ncbi:MAG: beta-ketoacyl synthase chain length factor [Nitrospirae bacterium]|nr:beta-ketoacyl synthase chain length factor [Nitrospirota bacterium]
MTRVAISGVGAISPAGVGVRPLVAAAAAGDRISAAAIGLSVSESAALRKLRRSAPITLYGVSAVDEALRDAGTGGCASDDYALIAGITNGALNFSVDFHKELLAREMASPALFSESVLNAPAGNASIAFNIRGPVHTLVGGPSVAIKALMLAASLIATGRAACVAAVCAEERNALSSFCYSRLQPLAAGALSEGAGALLLEPEDKSRGGQLCVLSGYASGMVPGDPQGALRRVIDSALAMSGLLALEDINVGVTDIKTTELIGDKVPVLSFFDVLGHAFCVSTIWNIILAAMAIRGSAVTPVFAGKLKKYAKHSEINHVIIYTTEESGAAAAVILSRAHAHS